MITYNDLYEALRKERYGDELQLMKKSFLSDVFEYFEEKKKFSDKKDDMFSDVVLKSKKRLENAMALFKELMLRRRKKVLNLAFISSETGISKKDFENLLDFEKELFEDIVRGLEMADKNLNNSLVLEKKEEPVSRLVRFTDSVEELMGMDGETIGPFSKGEVVTMNIEIANILVQDKKVEVLEEN